MSYLFANRWQVARHGASNLSRQHFGSVLINQLYRRMKMASHKPAFSARTLQNELRGD